MPLDVFLDGLILVFGKATAGRIGFIDLIISSVHDGRTEPNEVGSPQPQYYHEVQIDNFIMSYIYNNPLTDNVRTSLMTNCDEGQMMPQKN